MNNASIESDRGSQDEVNRIVKDDGIIAESYESNSGWDEVVEEDHEEIEEEVIEDEHDTMTKNIEDVSEEEIIEEEIVTTSMHEEEIIEEEIGKTSNHVDDNRSIETEEVVEEIIEEEEGSGSHYYEEEIVEEDEEDNSPKLPTLIEEEDSNDVTSIPEENEGLEAQNDSVVASAPEEENNAVLTHERKAFQVVTPLRTTIIVSAPLSPEKSPRRVIQEVISTDAAPFLDDSQVLSNIHTQEPEEMSMVVEPSFPRGNNYISTPVDLPTAADDSQLADKSQRDDQKIALPTTITESVPGVMETQEQNHQVIQDPSRSEGTRMEESSVPQKTQDPTLAVKSITENQPAYFKSTSNLEPEEMSMVSEPSFLHGNNYISTSVDLPITADDSHLAYESQHNDQKIALPTTITESEPVVMETQEQNHQVIQDPSRSEGTRMEESSSPQKTQDPTLAVKSITDNQPIQSPVVPDLQSTPDSKPKDDLPEHEKDALGVQSSAIPSIAENQLPPETSTESDRKVDEQVNSKQSRKPFSSWFNYGARNPESSVSLVPQQSPKPFDESMDDTKKDDVGISSTPPFPFPIFLPENERNETPSQQLAPKPELQKNENEINNVQNKSLAPRPYDEHIEQDDPTDEWESRSAEIAMLAKNSYRKSSNQFVASGEIPKESMTENPDDETTSSNVKPSDTQEQRESMDSSGFDLSSKSLPSRNNYDGDTKPSFLATPFAKEYFSDDTDREEEVPNRIITTTDKIERGEEAPNLGSPKHDSIDDERMNSLEDGTHDVKVSQSEESFLQSRKYWILVVILILIIVALVIVLGVMLGGHKKESKNIVTSPSPTASITTTPPTISMKTIRPTSTPRYWQQAGVIKPEVFVYSFGSSVAIGTTQLAVAAPTGLGNGAVFTYQNLNGTWSNVITSQLYGEQNGDQFGKSIAMTNNMLVVGAPYVVSPGTTVPVGAVYVYGYFGQSNGNNNAFQPYGNTLFSDSGIYAAYEEFGASVAVDQGNSLIIVGAPKSNTATLNATGRAYIYQLDNLGTSWGLMFNQTGSVANGHFGTSVDMTNDGSHFVVGAPDVGTGSASLYWNNGSTWQLVVEVQGADGETGFGSAVRMLASNGSVFAVGNPTFQANSGKVVVYALVDSAYVQQGQPIIGSSGEFLGAINMISPDSLTGTSILLGTELGEIKRYVYDGSSQNWIPSGAPLQANSSITQIATSSNPDLLIVGGDSEAAVYEYTQS